VMDARNEWTKKIRSEVLEVLTGAVRRGGYSGGVMPYLQRLSAVSVQGYVLHRLNQMVADGADLSLLVDAQDVPALFSACVAGLAAGDHAAARSCSTLQRDMVYTLGELARAGLVARGLWSEKAEGLLQTLFAHMMVALRPNETAPMADSLASARPDGRKDGDGRGRAAKENGEQEEGGVKGVCGWLHGLLQAAAPAVSCDTAAPALAHSSMVRVLVEVAAHGERQGGKAGDDVAAGSLHLLGCAIKLCQGTQHELIHLILNDGQLVSQLKRLAERGCPPALLLMSQLLEHPSEGEAVRLSIPERQFWVRVEQACGEQEGSVGGGARDVSGKDLGIRAILPSLKWCDNPPPTVREGLGRLPIDVACSTQQPIRDARAP
jgi:hypothetical protein